MKVLLISVGSRGDAEPFCALAGMLVAKGHSVEIFCQPELQSLIPVVSDGITVHSLPFTQFDFYKYAAAPSKGQDHENIRVRFVGAVTDIIAQLVLPCYAEVSEVASRCDIMVTSALARSLCFALTQKLDIPTALVHLQPLVPAKLFPHYSATDSCLHALREVKNGSKDVSSLLSDDYMETYWYLEKYQHEFLQEALDQLYGKDQLNLSPTITFDATKEILSGNHPKVLLINSFYEELIPALPDAGPRVYQNMGPLADDYIPNDFVPDPKLESFLEQNTESLPACVGYGSMPYEQVALILKVLQRSNTKAVLVGKALEQVPPEFADWAQENIYRTSSVPYTWLLPHCSMMLCHGGAGVVHATLRAGIPVVISPFMGDQFFYAKLLQDLGLGCQAGDSLPLATEQDLIQGIETAKTCVQSAREFGAKVRAKPLSGVERTVALLEDEVGKGN